MLNDSDGKIRVVFFVDFCLCGCYIKDDDILLIRNTNTIMNKFEFLEETIKQLGLSRQEVVNYFTEPQSSQSVAIDISLVEPGMFWYDDNTFSYERLTSKKIKAVVELVENGVIYGDLTASELSDIKEQKLPWDDAKRFIEEFSYPCQENEKIVWYDIGQLEKVYSTYELVKQAFYRVGKPFRKGYYWSSTETSSTNALVLHFLSGDRWYYLKYGSDYVRPVLSLDTRCLV